MYDANAKNLAIKAIGTVESNMNYAAVNYNDPITVGFAQWYGTRAAHIINRMRNENPSSFTGVQASFVASLNTYSESNSYWNNRYLTRAEGNSLAPVLSANKAIQNDQAIADLVAYENAARSAGINPDTNTAMMLLFYVAYHQSPKRALNVIASIGPNSTIDRLYSALLNEPVLGKYKTRYTTAKNIIDSGDFDVPDEPYEPPTEQLPGGNANEGLIKPEGLVKYLDVQGDTINIHFADGHIVTTLPNGRGWFIPRVDGTIGATVPDAPGIEPTNPPAEPSGNATRDALVEFVTSRIDRYAYSQGASRLNPEANMYTDCSGLMYFTFQSVMGINIGTYTGDQYQRGTLVATGSGTNYPFDIMQPGDLIFYNMVGGRNTVDHVEMYIGNGNVCGHGGPDNGPDIQSLSNHFTKALNWYIRRHVN